MNPRFIPVAAAAIIMAAPMAEADNFFDIEGGDATSVGGLEKEEWPRQNGGKDI